MNLHVLNCIRCERQYVPGWGKVCPKTPDGGEHETLPNAFLPKGWPPQEDYIWSKDD